MNRFHTIHFAVDDTRLKYWFGPKAIILDEPVVMSDSEDMSKEKKDETVTGSLNVYYESENDHPYGDDDYGKMVAAHIRKTVCDAIGLSDVDIRFSDARKQLTGIMSREDLGIMNFELDGDSLKVLLKQYRDGTMNIDDVFVTTDVDEFWNDLRQYRNLDKTEVLRMD
jgi:hypothetical protein